MNFFISIIALVFISAPVFAAPHKSIQCETDTYKITTYQSPTAADEVLVLVQENEMGIYSRVFSEIHEAEPVAVWLLKETQNPENVVNIVATGEGNNGVADVRLDMGEYGVFRAFGIPCNLNIYNIK